MTYATTAEVQGKFPKFPLSSGTTPTQTQADTMQAEVYAELNVVLAAQGITIPYATDATAVGDAFADWLQGVEAHGSAARILKAMFPGATGPDEEAAWSFHQSIYDKALKGLKDGSLVPPGIGASGSKAEPVSYPMRHPETEPSDGTIGTARFRMADCGPDSVRF